MLFLLPEGEGQDEGGLKQDLHTFPPATRDSVSLRGDAGAPVIFPRQPDNRRVFFYGGGGLKARR